jgi:hypothetical protein
LTDKNRKKKNVIELMRQQKVQKQKAKEKGARGKSKSKSRPPIRSGGHSRKMKKSR